MLVVGAGDSQATQAVAGGRGVAAVVGVGGRSGEKMRRSDRESQGKASYDRVRTEERAGSEGEKKESPPSRSDECLERYCLLMKINTKKRQELSRYIKIVVYILTYTYTHTHTVNRDRKRE